MIEVAGRILTLHRDPATDNLYGHFFNLDGTESEPEFQISTGDHGDESFAAVWQDGIIDANVLTDGRVAIVWADAKTGSDSTEVWLTVLNADGSVSVAERMANVNHIAGEQFHPRVYALDDGGFLVTFDQNLTLAADPRGFAQLFDATGNAVGDLLELGAGIAGNGGTGYGYVYPDGTGFMIDWYGNVQEISSGTGTNPYEGTNGRDKFIGTADADVMTGKERADVLIGLAGDDDLSGNSGNDRLLGGAGRDQLKGGGGDDLLRGGKDGDWLHGAKGDDRLFGGSGNDQLYGSAGNDLLHGGAGRDLLNGGRGNDTLTGGAHRDTFIFNNKFGKDVITDFQDNIDTIVLDEALWGGEHLTTRQVLDRFGSVSPNQVVLDFGVHELTIIGIDDLADLRNDIDFVWNME